MRLGLCALGLGAILSAGCGGQNKTAAVPPSVSTSVQRSLDPGLDAVTRMIGAARARDRVALWSLLSDRAQRRLGPTLPDFRKTGARQLERRVRNLSRNGLHEVVSDRITGKFGVVAVASGRRVFAAPLRFEHGSWRMELGRGRLAIRVVGPDVGSVTRVQQIAFEIHGAPGGATAILYADGVNLRSREAVAGGSATVYANLESPLTRGRHTAVAFATDGDAAVARAWTFVAR